MKKNITTGMILTAVILMDLLTGIEFDLFVPSFPQLQTHFSLTPFWVEALLSVNFIGYCISLFFVGGLADRYGRKPIILIGLITFVIGSILCLCEQSFDFLLIGRCLQGIGIAAPAILSFLINADTYPIKQQQFLMAMLNGSLNTAAAAAPVFGSYIALYFHWQGNFTALLILGLITLVITVFFIPSYKLPTHKEVILPQKYIQLIQSRPLMLLITTLLFIFVPYWIFVGMSPLLYIKDFGVSLQHFGYYQGVLALIFAIGSILYGFIIKNSNHNLKNMLSITLWIFIVSIIMLVALIISNSENPVWITFAIIVFVIGQIIPSTLLYPICLNFIPQAKGRASAILQGGRLIVTAIGLQIAGFFYVGSFQNIGIIISSFILIAVIMLFFVIRNRQLMSI